jgi:dipeptidyl aminopeptidase/acylaminoacyl peptidase
MKKFLIPGAALAMALGTIPAQHAVAQATPFPIEYWAAPSIMSNVSVSPNGKYVAFMKSLSQKGEPIIEVYEAANLSAKPYRVGAKSMEINGFDWISDEEMVVSFQKQVRKKIRGFNQGTFKGKLALFSMDNKKFKELSGDNFGYDLVNILPEEPNHVLARYTEFKKGTSFQSPSYYKVDVKTGQKELVLKGTDDRYGYRFDHLGNPRFSAIFDQGTQEQVFQYRKPGESGWTEYFRLSEDSPETFGYQGLVDGNDDQIYVTANNGHDKVGLWKYNLSSKSFGELVYRRNDVDIRGTLRHSNGWANPGKVTGISHYKDKFHRRFFDPSEEAMYKQFERSVPNAGLISITSRSRDGNVMVVRNIGPKDPGTFYLFDNGKFSRLGSTNGLLKADGLSDVEYITYTSRDGKSIPAFVTVPKGPGPHPLVVMPHGGPFVSEVVLFDEWAQLLANNGYMVMQPQYRGSLNYGQEFYQAGFIKGGEGGKKMQDDKDDGVKHLISSGRVDKDRVAMFGWSYGGYAALIAAARTPNLYQCVIAGAAVADNLQQVNYYRNRIDGWQKVEQLKFWDGSINPIDEVDKVNVPMFMVHGSADQRVPLKHAKKYVSAMKKAGKDFKYMELEDADHFSNTLYYKHKMDFYPAMIDYLKKDCGPGGL